ncbi:hypothetical protein HG530_000015 [Fusarium avenaceum]|nr:hypothetical protein HG530_000015 [Fusarium avenaceum]
MEPVLIHGDGSVGVTVADLDVLLSDTVKDIGSLGGNLEQPSGSTAGGILRSEKEGEDGLGDLVVVEHAEKRSGLLNVVGFALLLGLPPALRLDHRQNPGIHDTGDLTTSSHADLALGGALGKLGQDHISGLLSVPGLGERKDNGKVDKFEGSGDQVVILSDLGNGLIGDVVADKGSARDGTHDLTELMHERNGLATGVLGHLKEMLEVVVVRLLLTGQVAFESFAGEKTVEALAEVDMSLSIKEHPVVVSKKLRGNVDNSGLDVAGRVEDLAGHITGRSNNNEPRGLYATQRAIRVKTQVQTPAFDTASIT